MSNDAGRALTRLVVWSVIDILILVARNFIEPRLMTMVFILGTLWVFVLFIQYAIIVIKKF